MEREQSGLRIGIDFDNTIAGYDRVFAEAALEAGFERAARLGSKKAIRDALRELPGGELAWQRLQARVYGPLIGGAELIEGVADFLRHCRRRAVPVFVISHKTEYAPGDSSTNLRQAALGWMEAKGFFAPDGLGLFRERVFFEGTREAKIARIAELGLSHYIDDLEEVFHEPSFPAGVARCLLVRDEAPAPRGPFEAFAGWRAIADAILGAEDPAAAAEALCGAAVHDCVPLRGGANNRVFRVRSATGEFALKLYPTAENDPRDRLGAEVAALEFLARHGVASVPKVVAADRAQAAVLLTWVEGEPVTEAGERDLSAALDLVCRLHGLRNAEGAYDLPLASEACLSGAELIRQVEDRLARLFAAGEAEPALAAFLEERCRPALAPLARRLERIYAGAGLAPAVSLPAALRMLSPSDFGFHNARRRPDGSLVFLDFEYFGWDDPAKLAADFVLHPGMRLSAAQKKRFLEGCRALFGAEDRAFAARLEACRPLYALRWCAILLNEFLPERWARRLKAGVPGDLRVRCRDQLAKAEQMFDLAVKDVLRA